jgi:hypothetical protein
MRLPWGAALDPRAGISPPTQTNADALQHNCCTRDGRATIVVEST